MDNKNMQPRRAPREKETFFDFLKRKDAEAAIKPRIVGATFKQYFVLILVLFLAVHAGVFLFYYSVIEGDSLRALAAQSRTQTDIIKANRGTIYDANGTVLAQSSTTWNVILSAGDIAQNEEAYREAYDKEKAKAEKEGKDIGPYVPLNEVICKKLSEMFDEDYNKLLEESRKTNIKYYIVERSVDKEIKTQIEQFKDEKGIPQYALHLEPTSERTYPNGTLASNIIGFTNSEGEGVYGLEAYYEEYLKGTDGKAVYGVSGNRMGLEDTADVYFSAEDGYSLVLTLDEVLQHYLEKNLELCVSQHQVINRASGVIMNCKTGAILAMATAPSFDLNARSTLMSEYDKQQLQLMIEAGATEEEIAAQEAIYREQQWKNKAITELYYPGSVFKTITCAAALEEEVVSLHSTFDCYAVADVAGTKIKCWSAAGHGHVDLQTAVTKSCNPSFIAIGQLLGADKFCDYFEAFGFTQPTGIDLPGESGSLYVTRDRMGIVELASSSFGQTNKVTPIQMCTAFSAVVNGGYLLTPYVVDKVLDSDGNVVETTQTQVKRQVISEETSATMRQILENVVIANGGSNAYISGYRIGGKSGTTEKIDEYNERLATTGEDKMDYVPSFAAFAPADDPEIVMLVMADTPTGTQYYGSAVAAPVVSAVFKEGLPHLGIYPTYTAEELAKMDESVPYVLGMEAMRAESALSAKGFEVRFVGDTTGSQTVTTQIPQSSTSIPKGSTVVLYMGNDIELETGVVPDVTDMSVEQANEAIVNAGFNIKIVGGAAENSAAVATAQSVLGGVEAYKGNVIEVTFQVNGYSD